jgi:hypothetical protein
MLPGTRQIGELEIHELHVVVLDHFADVRGGFVFGHWIRWSVAVVESGKS